MSTSSEPMAGDWDAPAQKPSLFGNDELIEELAGKAAGEGSLEEVLLFGRTRMIDFSQFVPRGHYVNSPVEPSGVNPCTPAAIRSSHSLARTSAVTLPATSTGETRYGNTPWKVACVFIAFTLP